MDKAAKQEFVVLQKAYDLVVELIPRIHKFPRDHKFTLGDRIENAGLDALMQRRGTVPIRQGGRRLSRADGSVTHPRQGAGMRHVLAGVAAVLVLCGCRYGPSSGEVERWRVRLTEPDPATREAALAWFERQDIFMRKDGLDRRDPALFDRCLRDFARLTTDPSPRVRGWAVGEISMLGTRQKAADAVVPALRGLFEAEWAARRTEVAEREPNSYVIMYDALRALKEYDAVEQVAHRLPEVLGDADVASAAERRDPGAWLLRYEAEQLLQAR